MNPKQAFDVVKQLCERVPLQAADNEIMRQALEVLKNALEPVSTGVENDANSG